MMTFNLTTGLF